MSSGSTSASLTSIEDASIKACMYIDELCKKIGMKKASVTAKMFFHKFFLKQSMQEHDKYFVAAACVFLSGKVEEEIKKLRDVVSAAFELRMYGNKNRLMSNDINPESKEYILWRDSILASERCILHTLGFNLKADHPYSKIKEFLNSISQDQEYKEFKEKTYSFVNDSLMSNLCVRYKHDIIAAAGILLTAKFIKSQNPSGSQLAIAEKVIQKEQIALAKRSENKSETANQSDVSDFLFFGFPPEEVLLVVKEMLDFYVKIESKSNAASDPGHSSSHYEAISPAAIDMFKTGDNVENDANGLHEQPSKKQRTD